MNENYNNHENRDKRGSDNKFQEFDLSTYLGPGDDCLPLDRVFTAIGLTPEEQQHLNQCRFCQSRIKKFSDLPLEVRRPVPLYQPEEAIVTPGYPHINFIRRLAIAAVLFISVVFGTGATVVAWRERAAALVEAAQSRQRLQSLHEAVGLSNAVDLYASVEQPNFVKLNGSADPTLITSLAVSYDGENFLTLYTGAGLSSENLATLRPINIEDEHSFVLPATGKKTVTALVRAEYSPQVIAAFPEYKEPAKTEQSFAFELTNSGIVRLAGEDPNTAKPEISLCVIPLDLERWEVTNSSDAIAHIEGTPGGSGLLEHFQLPRVGEYTNISRAIPGTTPTHPTISLERLTYIEIKFVLDSNDPVILEPKLIDDQGRIAGTVKLVEPERGSQTVRVATGTLKGYWGKRIDLRRIRRFDLAVTRTAQNYSAEGTINIQQIEMFGTGPVLASAEHSEQPLVIFNMPIEPARWKTAQSKRGHIELSGDSNQLVCQVRLPYNKQIDEELPWTNIETELVEPNFADLNSIEIVYKWDGPLPITLEPKLMSSGQLDTYGRPYLVSPSSDYQQLSVYPQDLKYYWTVVGENNGAGMNLRELKGFSLGIARKSQEQAEQGTLHIKAIRFLGPNPESKPTSMDTEKGTSK